MKKLLETEGDFYNMTTFYYISKLRLKIKRLAAEALDIYLVKDQGYKLILRA